MPTYEYRCKACGHELEAVQAFSDDALTACPACQAEELRKVFGSVGIAFRGSGFYKNDSRDKTSSSTGTSGASGSTTSSDTGTSGSSKDSGSKDSGSKDSGSSSSDSSSTSSTPKSPAKSVPSSDAKSA